MRGIEKMKRRRRKKSLTFLVSFVAVVVVLMVAAISAYFQSELPTIRHIPDAIPSYSASWAKYAPESAYLVTFRNYTAVRTYNSSAFSLGNLIQLASPLYAVQFTKVEALLTLGFSKPNATLDIAFVNTTTVVELQHALQNTTLTAREGDASLYFVQLVSNQQTAIGWLFTIPSDGVVGFSEGGSSARSVIDRVLGARAGTIANTLSSRDIDRMFYIVGGVVSHLAFTFQNFSGIVTTGQKTLVSVDIQNSIVRSSYVVEFNGSDYALSQYGYTKSVYFTANEYVVFDQYILATKYSPITMITAAVRDVG
jgi:hypothetical protein